MSAPLPRTIAEASRLLESRVLSPVDQARAAEAEITKGRRRGPLHGIPFGAKDNFETRGIRTTGHSRVYEKHVPQADAAVIEQLYGAGAILMGKLALHELAHGGPSFDLP